MRRARSVGPADACCTDAKRANATPHAAAFASAPEFRLRFILLMQLFSVARKLSSAAPADHLRDTLSAGTKSEVLRRWTRTIRSHLHVVNCLKRHTSVCGDS